MSLGTVNIDRTRFFLRSNAIGHLLLCENVTRGLRRRVCRCQKVVVEMLGGRVSRQRSGRVIAYSPQVYNYYADREGLA